MIPQPPERFTKSFIPALAAEVCAHETPHAIAAGALSGMVTLSGLRFRSQLARRVLPDAIRICHVPQDTGENAR